MTDLHPNVALLRRLDLSNLASCADLFAEGFVWHYFNQKMPDLEGNYAGVAGLQRFFDTLAGKTGGTFKVTPLSATAYGDELVVTHVQDMLTLDAQSLTLDAIVVWRIVDGRLAEAWDIPAIHTEATLQGSRSA